MSFWKILILLIIRRSCVCSSGSLVPIPPTVILSAVILPNVVCLKVCRYLFAQHSKNDLCKSHFQLEQISLYWLTLWFTFVHCFANIQVWNVLTALSHAAKISQIQTWSKILEKMGMTYFTAHSCLYILQLFICEPFMYKFHLLRFFSNKAIIHYSFPQTSKMRWMYFSPHFSNFSVCIETHKSLQCLRYFWQIRMNSL